MSDVRSRRLDRLRHQSVRTGLTTIEQAAALSAVGFEPVSEVTGAIARNINTGGFYPEAARPVDGVARTYTSSTGGVALGQPPAITAQRTVTRTALARLVEEATAVGADGVVGVQLELDGGGELGLWHAVASGTAVRSRGRTRAAVPFTTTLPPAQVAAALRAGWVPVSVLSCPVVAVRWLDPLTRQQLNPYAGNNEVDGYSELMTTARRQAAADFAAAARAVRADGAVMSGMSVRLANTEIAEVQVLLTGTALARFRAPDRPTPLPIIALSRGRS